MVAYGQGFGCYGGLKCWFVGVDADFSMRQRLIDFACDERPTHWENLYC